MPKPDWPITEVRGYSLMDLREKSEMVKGTPGSEISQRYRDAITALRKTDVLTELDFGDAIERVIESVSQYEQGISNEDNSFMLPCSEEDLVIFTIEIPSTVLTRFIVDISTPSIVIEPESSS